MITKACVLSVASTVVMRDLLQGLLSHADSWYIHSYLNRGKERHRSFLLHHTPIPCLHLRFSTYNRGCGQWRSYESSIQPPPTPFLLFYKLHVLKPIKLPFSYVRHTHGGIPHSQTQTMVRSPPGPVIPSSPLSRGVCLHWLGERMSEGVTDIAEKDSCSESTVLLNSYMRTKAKQNEACLHGLSLCPRLTALVTWRGSFLVI